MNKKNITALILVFIISMGIGYLLSQFAVVPESERLKFGSSSLPNNANISADQKFIFENPPLRDASKQEVSKLVGVAVSTAKDVDSVSIDSACTPNVPVINMYPYKSVLFKNVSSSTQILEFGPSIKISLSPNMSRSLSTKDIGPNLASGTGFTVKSFTCSGTIRPAGFLVFYPD